MYKKVYCKNCQYITRCDQGYMACSFNAKKINEYTDNDYFKLRRLEVYNFNGNCLDYKKKWWKFWVK